VPILVSITLLILGYWNRLNLTAANHIFIIEPQWNPSLEDQAIARAIRINQQDKVIVTRYIMSGTVEEVCTQTPLFFEGEVSTLVLTSS
jgi:hypothetical protein